MSNCVENVQLEYRMAFVLENGENIGIKLLLFIEYKTGIFI